MKRRGKEKLVLDVNGFFDVAKKCISDLEDGKERDIEDRKRNNPDSHALLR